MKKSLLFFLFCLITSTHLFSQARIGSSPEAIIIEFLNNKPRTGYTDTGIKFVMWRSKLQSAAYYFTNDICDFCIIEPLTQGELNYMVENFNSTAVIISSTEWKLYTNNGYIHINLISSHDSNVFTYSTH